MDERITAESSLVAIDFRFARQNQTRDNSPQMAGLGVTTEGRQAVETGH